MGVRIDKSAMRNSIMKNRLCEPKCGQNPKQLSLVFEIHEEPIFNFSN